jgi:hypothetical protein
MLKGWFAALAAIMLVVSGVVPQNVLAKTKSDSTFAFPKDKPIKIILFRPDVEVSSLGVGGLPTPNPDWTADARRYFLAALKNNNNSRANQIVELGELTGDDAAYAAEYQSLFKAVGTAAFTHGFLAKLPSKKMANGKYKFDWTLGPGAKRLSEIGGGNYGLFVYGYDAYATAGRKMFQFIMAAAVGYLPPGGQHLSYASLVDLDTGNIVWFNFYANKKGDIRTAEGALERAEKLLSTLPLREGEVAAKPKRK